jgi:hypothetical protein
MKVSYRTHPILKILESKSFDTVKFFEFDKDDLYSRLPRIKEMWRGFAPLFSTKIHYLTQPFYNAFKLAAPKLGETIGFDMVNIGEEYGTYIMPGKDKRAVCYFILYSEGVRHLCFFMFYNDTLYFYGETVIKPKDTTPDPGIFWLSKALYKSQEEYIAEGSIGIAEIVTIINFIKYAEIEVKYLPANKRVKDISTKYVNETDSNIQVLDSTWFTTLVKSDAFKVRGHFRLQPYGPGLKEKKLIWINDFEKQGYVRNFKRPVDID